MIDAVLYNLLTVAFFLVIFLALTMANTLFGIILNTMILSDVFSLEKLRKGMAKAFLLTIALGLLTGAVSLFVPAMQFADLAPFDEATMQMLSTSSIVLIIASGIVIYIKKCYVKLTSIFTEKTEAVE